MRRIVTALLCVAVAVPGIAVAAAPRKGGHYTGKSTPLLGSKRHTVSIRISGDGRTGTFRYCGDRRRRAMSARFIVRKGRFTARRRERRRGGARVVTFQATGRFTSRTRVRGRIVVVFECDHAPGTYTARLRR
ncbi:MAG TPA: hypothetical protein VFB51_01095 [Solirubrobacterales bacterium]|nr:hypothetical protein [Solirubrobacterales bacterium]